MKKYNNISGYLVYLVYFAIIIVVCFIMYIFQLNYYKSKSIEVEPELLFSILQPGTYTGTSNYSGTEIYKNGLFCKHQVVIKNDMGHNLHVTNNVRAYDAITNKLEYTGVRIVKFNYKLNHNNNLFKISQSYINDNLVSSSYGYASVKTNNSISFKLSGSWHISGNDYTNIYNTITRTDNETIDTQFTQFSMLGFNKLVMDEKYTMI